MGSRDGETKSNSRAKLEDSVGGPIPYSPKDVSVPSAYNRAEIVR